MDTSWTDDIKIHALSKSHFIAGVALLPVVGNLVCLVKYVVNYNSDRSTVYLEEASRKRYFGTKKHSDEIKRLYISRKKHLPEKELAKSLRIAAVNANEETLKLILESRDWTTSTLKNTLKDVHSKESAQLLLDKCKDELTNEEVGEILIAHCSNYKETSYPIIELLTREFHKISIDSVGDAIVEIAENANAKEPMGLLLNKFPNIDKGKKDKAILKAFRNKNIKLINFIIINHPEIIENKLYQLLLIASEKGFLVTDLTNFTYSRSRLLNEQQIETLCENVMNSMNSNNHRKISDFILLIAPIFPDIENGIKNKCKENYMQLMKQLIS